jgi:hypothetical protein
LQFGLVLGHSLLGLTRLLFLLNSASARRRASSVFMLKLELLDDEVLEGAAASFARHV